MTVNTRDMPRFYLDHQSCAASPLESYKKLILKTRRLLGVKFPSSYFSPGELKRKRSLSAVKKFEEPQRQDLICHVEFSYCGFLIIHSSALCISISGIGKPRLAFTFALSDLSGESFGDAIGFTCAARKPRSCLCRMNPSARVEPLNSNVNACKSSIRNNVPPLFQASSTR